MVGSRKNRYAEPLELNTVTPPTQPDRITTLTFGQRWGLDASGNWSRFTSTDDQGASLTALDQTRAHNTVNEIVANCDSSATICSPVGDRWMAPAHDRQGIMTHMSKPDALIDGYDWLGRLPFIVARWQVPIDLGFEARLTAVVLVLHSARLPTRKHGHQEPLD